MKLTAINKAGHAIYVSYLEEKDWHVGDFLFSDSYFLIKNYSTFFFPQWREFSIFFILPCDKDRILIFLAILWATIWYVMIDNFWY